MGTLDVSVNGTSVWTMSGDQGNTWHPAQVDLAAYATSDSIVVVFTGTRGTSFTELNSKKKFVITELIIIQKFIL